MRDAQRSERGLERGTPALDRRADDADPLGRRARPDQREDLLANELGRATRSRTLEEPNGALELDRLAARIGEEPALEVDERNGSDLPRRKLADPPAGEAREVVRGARERRERRPAGLVRQRD